MPHVAAFEKQKYQIITKINYMQEVENYLIETEGVISKSDFAEDMQEDGFDCCIKIPNMNYCDKHEKEFDEWFKEQFPKIDLEYGGVCHFDVALS